MFYSNYLSFIIISGSILYFIFTVLSNVILNLYSYNPDSNYDMYFASRLLGGELIFTREFYDKFPLVSFLFIIPAQYKNIDFWIAGNIFVSLLASGALSVIINYIFYYYSNYSISLIIRLFISCLYLYFLSSIQGAFAYINPLSASFYIFFIYCILKVECKYKNIMFSNCWFILASLCASVTISIRPYYLLSILYILFWRMLFTKFSKRSSSSTYYISNIIKFTYRSVTTYGYFLFLMCVWFFIFNIFPYMLLNVSDSLFIGLRMLLLDLKPNNYFDTLYSQLLYFVGITLFSKFILIFSFAGLIFMIVFRKTNFFINDKKLLNSLFALDVICMSFIPIVFLEIMILSKHYWPHYMQLFVPNIVIFCGSVLCYIVYSETFYLVIKHVIMRLSFFYKFDFVTVLMTYFNYITLNIRKYIYLLLCIYVVCLFRIFFEIFHNTIDSVKFIQKQNNREYIMINTIRDIRHQRQGAGLGDDFLYTSNMFSHWMLGESRHGFPHAAHFSAISQGWFSNWNPRSVMPGFPTTTDNLCRKITLSGPSIVLVPKNSALFECMSSKPPINYSINGIFFDYDGPVAVMFRDISH